MRILLMVPIYAIISFFSYRFYEEAIYYETVRDCYEAFVIHSFFTLLLTYLGDSQEARHAKMITNLPELKKLMFPLNWGCIAITYNPRSPMFLYYMKYGILQYVVVKPVTTIAAVVLQYYSLYCTTSYNFHFGNVYITIVNFISVSVAMYCLIIFYTNIKVEIAEYSMSCPLFLHPQGSSVLHVYIMEFSNIFFSLRLSMLLEPLWKFLCVKLVIFFVFWQTLVLSMLGDFHVFKATEYWTVDNIEIGISALLICVEMVVFSIMHNYSFSSEPYVVAGERTRLGKSLRDAFNPMDLVRELGWACQDVAYLCMGRSIPVRDGHLSGSLKRTNTLRQNRFSKLGNSKGSNGLGPRKDSDGAETIVDPSALEAGTGGKFVTDPHQNAPLLSHIDGRNQNNASPYPFSSPGVGHDSYEMTPQQAHQQQQLQQQDQQYQQQQQQQYYQQQQQQQEQYASRPTDGYQY